MGMGGKLSLRNITKDFDGFEIFDLSLTVEPSEYLVIIGPTGAGKTLLLETIQGFHQLDQGEITLDEADITKVPQSMRRIAYVPQNPYFPPQNTVKEILEYGAYKLDYSNTQPMLQGLTNMMKLSDHLDRKVVTLSGGEKRKLSLARALLQQPLLLLLDEPLSNLDTISKHELREEIAAIHNYLDVTVIHVTHDQTEALTLADRIAVIRDGRLVIKGNVEYVYNNPSVEYVARFLGYQNVYDITSLEQGRLTSKIKIGDIILRTSSQITKDQKKVAIHGSEVILHRKTPLNIEDNLFQSEIMRIITTGPTAYITVNFGLQMVLTMGRRAYKASNLKVGEKLWVQFSTNAVKPIRD